MYKQDLLENEQALFKNIQNDISNLGMSETVFDSLVGIIKVLTEQIDYLKIQDTKFFDVREYIQKLAELFASLLNESSKTKENIIE